jgi:hypothetical protein
MPRIHRRLRACTSPRTAVLLAAVLLAACGAPPRRPWPERSPSEVRAQLVELLPARLADRDAWAVDIQAAFAHLDLLPSTDNLCAALAMIEQETGYVANPAVPNLPKIARAEIERRAARLKIPKLAVSAALRLPSGDGRSFAQRLEALRTEKDMSDLFVEFIGRVPLGERLFGSANPVRTGGSMQVSIEFAEEHARRQSYPYAVESSIRDEVFTRRGGVYFGIAHLLQYPANYERHIYRYADFNAGWYASRNAAFQQAVSRLSGVELALDGDLRRRDAGLFDRVPGRTEAAVLSLAGRLNLSERRIRSDLAREDDSDFEQSDTWRAVFAAADARAGAPLPRAVLPRITLQGPKISRNLTTAWFAQRVESRYRQCINRAYRS